MFKYSCTYVIIILIIGIIFVNILATQKHYNIDQYDDSKKCNYLECKVCNYMTTSKQDMNSHTKKYGHHSITHYIN